MVGKRIREIRKSKTPKMSGEKLAELSNLSLVTIYNLEAGKTPDVKLDTIDRIAKALEIPIGILTDDSLTIEAMRAQVYLKSIIEQHFGSALLAADSGKIQYGSHPTENIVKKSRVSNESKTSRVPWRIHKQTG